MGRVRETKFGTNVSHKILLIAAECQGYGFTVYEFSPPRLGLTEHLWATASDRHC